MAEKLKQAERDAAMWKIRYETLYKKWYVEKFDNLPAFERDWAARAYMIVNWKSPNSMTMLARNKFKVKYMEEKEWVKESIYWNKKSWWSKVNEELVWKKWDEDFEHIDEIIDIELPFE